MENFRNKIEAAVTIGLAIYARMVRLAHDNNQVVGEKGSYYVTLEQLEQNSRAAHHGDLQEDEEDQVLRASLALGSYGKGEHMTQEKNEKIDSCGNSYHNFILVDMTPREVGPVREGGIQAPRYKIMCTRCGETRDV